MNISNKDFKSLREIYSPVQFFNPQISTGNCTCSYSQKTKMMLHLEAEFATLEHLCNEVQLKVHQILITCAEIVEIATRVPSVAEKGKLINMQSDLAPGILRLASKLEDYYTNPSSVTPKSIMRDALLVADHNNI